MRRLTTVVTGSLAVALSPCGTQVAMGVSFDEALGVRTPGVIVEVQKAAPFASIEGGREYLVTDTHDAVVHAVEIDDQLLAEGMVHSTIEGPIGPDDPSVTGEIRSRRRRAVTPASLTDAASAAEAHAMQAGLELATADEQVATDQQADEPLLITDRVVDAEAIDSSPGWADRFTSAFSRLLKRQP